MTTVVLRPPSLADEPQVARAQLELAVDDFEFVFQRPGEPWPSYVARVEREHLGIDIAPDRVPATFLLAEVGSDIVGRVSIRHELNEHLSIVGGHIGYAVRPAFRRRGYGLSILRQSLTISRDLGLTRVLITCDDDNAASIKLIEACSGILDDVITPAGGVPTRRYWIELNQL